MKKSCEMFWRQMGKQENKKLSSLGSSKENFVDRIDFYITIELGRNFKKTLFKNYF